jgi:hypothetical protein
MVKIFRPLLTTYFAMLMSETLNVNLKKINTENFIRLAMGVVLLLKPTPQRVHMYMHAVQTLLLIRLMTRPQSGARSIKLFHAQMFLNSLAVQRFFRADFPFYCEHGSGLANKVF